MKNLKKKALMAGSYVAVASIAVGGTLALLTDTKKNTNVMTLDNVKIEQHEYQRAVDENGDFKKGTFDGQESYVLEAFEQGKSLLPTTDPTNHGAGPWDSTTVRMSQVDSYGGMTVFSNKNAEDKFVTVENTGSIDAYVRTYVALEVGSLTDDLIGVGHHQTWEKKEIGIVEIEGYNYSILEFTYKGGELSDGSWRHKGGILPADDTSYPSLSQVYLDSSVTSEDIEKIDGNKNGLYEIFVISQAVQADGFDDAATALNAGFGEASPANIQKWFTADDVITASPAANATRPAGYIPSTKGEVIDHLVIVDNSDENTNLRALYNGEGGEANYTTDDIVIMNSHLDGTYAMNLYAVAGSGAKLIVNDTELKGWVSYNSGFASAEFTNCTFTENTNDQKYKTLCVYTDTVVTNCDFEAGYALELDRNPNATITFENCTIGGVALTSVDQFEIASTGATVVIK